MSQSNYHHGDLRNALIVAAVELIQEKGSADVAISEAAKRAGVSAAAPYRHFRDKSALLEAVAELCYYGLSVEALATRDQYEMGTRECVVALGKTYVTYVTQRPEFYNMMWGDFAAMDPTVTDRDGRRGFFVFVEAVDAWCQAHKLRHTEPLDLALKLWALAHGLAVLELNGQFEYFMPEADRIQMLASSTNAFLDGVEKAG
ncbi:hypothetical protein BST95_11265 [Halioglobus japonicus]|uniref:TetR/AcrR family transcriptional regulator n=1 Tax=Halioglobus japonicus TaxID=930805 RepID=A0AAP8SNL6_9GAMM|nr:TetR/AcrR family transcriptional regulator [Halioglobus japonicus]AQA18732.1 hypothetical protein BST95_11265 [Halioglobus japonicus]PLW86760.1 TetR/AcrR family transcriptional regulator [Halioglobus japonicus]GHD11206.1 hypothetical protein GCM10007052_10690 [Halioglobus japonicus]